MNWRPSRESTLAATACSLLAVVLVRAYLATRPRETLSEFADRAYALLDKGKGEELYRYLPRQQREHMSHEAFKSLIEWRNSCFQGYKPNGKRLDVPGESDQALKSAWVYQNADGVRFDNLMYFQRGPDGPILSAFTLISNAFQAKYMPRHLDKPVFDRNGLCVRDGLKQDGPALASFAKFVFIEPDLMTWDEMRIGIEARVALQERKRRHPDWPEPTADERSRIRDSIRKAISLGQL